jgi:hypothetical protein
LLIQTADTTGEDMLPMGKMLKAFRFDPELYAEFKSVAEQSGLMVTEAFEKFMHACIEAGAVKMPEAKRDRSGIEAEARVLLAWLRKGQTSYWGNSGDEEISIHTKLLQMLSQVEDEALRREIEEELKKS